MFFKKNTRKLIFLWLMLSIMVVFNCSICLGKEDSEFPNQVFPFKDEERDFEEGKKAFNLEQYEKSIISFRAILKTEANNYPAAYYLALSIAKSVLTKNHVEESDIVRGWDAFDLAFKNAKQNNLKDEKLYYAMSWYALMEYLTIGTGATINKKKNLTDKIKAYAQEATQINPKFSDAYNILGAVEELNGRVGKAV